MVWVGRLAGQRAPRQLPAVTVVPGEQRSGGEHGVDMSSDERHVYGPRAVGALLQSITRTAFRRRSPATAQVLTDWAEIVGPALARTTTPRRLSGKALTIACAGPVALELQHLSAELVARINGHLGQVVVEKLRFVQDAVAPAPAVPSPPRDLAPVSLPGVPPGGLYDALEALGRAVRTP